MRILSDAEIRALECSNVWSSDDANAGELERMHDKLVELGLMTRTLAPAQCGCTDECDHIDDIWIPTERGLKELQLQRAVRRA